ncbi:Crp/Fnr family transcriptional regulator [Dehalobacter sp. 14DCB1]|uniref:Crp/Fnr family transcriptional regulator n=1 Tax=Dehalobacter sp. 14DCB1 TaxID=2070227 RepID=UPI000362E010|nr:Crp/Fnr family transcriptional regulator [Dehalobacter sp. 14DCB1]TCX51677.1 Crp/Fnr family transcriptional regulator [Dehalobacter sp. 14DCB1]
MDQLLKSYILPDTFYPISKLLDYCHLGSIRNYGKGEIIVFPDEILDKVIFVMSGRFDVYTIADEGREILMYTAGRHCLMDRLFKFEEDGVEIVAMEDSKVCFFSKEQLLLIFKQDEQIIFDFFRNYHAKGLYFFKHFTETKRYAPSIRVLRLFHELYKSNGEFNIDHWEIKIALSNKMISEITGIHYVTVSKILASLRKEKILRKKTKAIIIYDLEKLKEMIDVGISY